MRTYLTILAATAALAAATAPASAFDSWSRPAMPVQAALDIAGEIGVATVTDAQFAGNEWQIEGRDPAGQYMEVDVDASTGAILNVDR